MAKNEEEKDQNTSPEEQPETTDPKAEVSGAKELAVYENGQFVRSYSIEIHGKKFVKNAEEFAAQKPTREIRKVR